MSSSDSDINEDINKCTNDNNDNDFVEEHNVSKKALFQQMGMNWNNKFKEAIKNKFKVHNSKESTSSFKSFTDFSPGASSTQIGHILNQNSLSVTQKVEAADSSDDNLDKSHNLSKSCNNSDIKTKKHKKHKSLYESELDDEHKSSKTFSNEIYEKNLDDTEKEITLTKKRKKKRQKETISNSSNSEFDSKDMGKKTNIREQTQEIMSNDSVDNAEDIYYNKTNKKLEQSISSSLDISKNNTNKAQKRNKKNIETQKYYESISESNRKENEIIKRKKKSKLQNDLSNQEISSTEVQFSLTKKDMSMDELDCANESEIRISNTSPISKKKHFDLQHSCPDINSKAESLLKELEKNNALSRSFEEHSLLTNLKSKQKLFIIQIPKKLDPNCFLGTKISLSETTRVPEDTRKYDCSPTFPTQEQVTVSCNTGNICNISITGNLQIQKHLKKKHVSEVSNMYNNTVSFPDTLKQRHPLFGDNFEEKINLEEHIKQKLKTAVDAYNKKKQLEAEQRSKSPEQKEEIFEFLNKKNKIDLPTKKKHKKSKNKLESDITFGNEGEEFNKKANKRKHVDEEIIDSPKKKRHKKHSLSDHSSQMINDILMSKSSDIINP